MTSKVYENLKRFIKENYKFLIFYVMLLLVFSIKLDYEVYTPGGLSNLDKRIDIEDAYESEGSFNLTYVSAKRGTIPVVLLSYIIPTWDLVSIKNSQIDNENYDEILARGRIDLNSVNENALLVAFKEANLKYEILNNNVTVYHVFKEAKTNLKIGDIIKKVDDVKITDADSLKKLLKDKSEGETVKLTVIRDNKTITRTAQLIKENDEIILGIYLTNVMDVDTDIEVNFNYKKNESGASGGLMTALDIYDKITSKDITKGLKIAGTGTINADGEVGKIGGVKYKLMGAVRKNADVFIVPSDNYQEAIKVKENNNYDIKIIKAVDFKGVLKSLEEI